MLWGMSVVVIHIFLVGAVDAHHAPQPRTYHTHHTHHTHTHLARLENENMKKQQPCTTTTTTPPPATTTNTINTNITTTTTTTTTTTKTREENKTNRDAKVLATLFERRVRGSWDHDVRFRDTSNADTVITISLPKRNR
jgi:hypothetical protein